ALVFCSTIKNAMYLSKQNNFRFRKNGMFTSQQCMMMCRKNNYGLALIAGFVCTTGPANKPGTGATIRIKLRCLIINYCEIILRRYTLIQGEECGFLDGRNGMCTSSLNFVLTVQVVC